MKLIKFFFQIGLFFLFCSVLFGGALVAVLLFKPNWIINPMMINYALEKTSLKENISWKKLETSIEKGEHWSYDIHVNLRDLCLNFETAKGCIKYVAASTDLSLPIRQDFKINTLGPVTVFGVDLALHQSESLPEEEPTDYVQIARTLLDVRYETIKLDLENLKIIPVEASEPTTALSGHLEFSGFSAGHVSLLTLNLKQSGESPWRQITGEAEIAGVTKEDLFKNLSISTKLRAAHKEGYVNFNGHVEPMDAQGERHNEFSMFYNVSGNKAVINSRGVLTKDYWKTRIDLDMKTVDHQIVGVSLNPCDLRMDFVNESPLNGFKTDLDCRGRGQRQKLSRENIIGLFVPESIVFGLNGNVAFNKSDESSRVETNLSLSVDRIASDLYNLDGQVLLNGVLDLDDARKTNHEARFAIGFEMPDFQKVVKRLATSEISIPAPLNQLAGYATCDLNGRFQTLASLNKFPIFCQSQLASEGQKLNLRLTSELSLRKDKNSYKPHAEGEILLDDVLFTMPDVDIRKPIPQMVPDKRFVSLEEATEREQVVVSQDPPISYNFRVLTHDDRPLRFRTELLPNVIPISLDLKIQDNEKMGGVVAVRGYQVTLFKRTAQIENIEVIFEPGQEDQGLKGRVTFPNKDYKLAMNIHGTLQEPSYNFVSNPPLDENQILGLLLFGEDPSQLDDETQRSIGQTQTAMADRAIGLLSMYYLASTPIERLGYDSSAQVFTAQFRLQEGVSLTLGSDAGSKGTVGLRKKLKGNWSIETTAERNSETDTQKGRASLNWSKRF